jgi:hypothetical protein
MTREETKNWTRTRQRQMRMTPVRQTPNPQARRKINVLNERRGDPNAMG